MLSIDLTRINAVVFDTDGVVTDTARVHAAAWKRVFDTFLKTYAKNHPDPAGPEQARPQEHRRAEPFDIRDDYLTYVDGRPRLDGVRGFLSSRGIALPEGDPSDAPGAATVHGLGLAKDRLFVEQVERYGVAAFPSTVQLLHELRHRGCRTAVVSASRNSRMVVRAAGLLHLFDVLVDGNDAARLGLPGKPDPALFLEAARRLGTSAPATAIVEDALPGVEAGRRGGFGLVIAVDRRGQAAALAAHGADVVVTDLDELTVTGRIPAGVR